MENLEYNLAERIQLKYNNPEGEFMKIINDYLRYIEAKEAPLSSNVFIIKGNKNTYIYDVGSDRISREEIKKIKNKSIIISHFHKDHMENLNFLSDDEYDLYIGDYIYKILGYGNVIKDRYEINDGIHLIIIYIPNSHAKGSLGLIINNEYLLIGDSLDGNRNGFNVSLLNEEIKLLKELDYKYVLNGHNDERINKEDIIKELEFIYSKRIKNKPYIGYDLLMNS